MPRKLGELRNGFFPQTVVQKRRVEELQDAASYAGIASKLFELHGVTGGKSSKSRRLARDVASFVASTVRVTARNLKEAGNRGDDELEVE